MNARTDHARVLRELLVEPKELAEALGLAVSRQRQSRGVYAACPWCGKPNCSITQGGDGTIRVHCFSCGESADALGLTAAARGLDLRRDFPAVLREAAEIAHYDMREAAPVRRRPQRPLVERLALRIDQLADDWARGRDIRPDPLLEGAAYEPVRDAFALLRASDALARERTESTDRELDRLADEWEASCQQ